VADPTPQDIVGSDEEVSRFLTSRSHWRADLSIRPQPLLPYWNADLQVWETSTYRVGGLTSSEIRDVGYAHVRKPDRNVHGHTLVLAHHVRANSLDVTSAEPPPRHAVIVSWPHEKPAQMNRAQELAKGLTATLYDGS
jgi:hypothetical protein